MDAKYKPNKYGLNKYLGKSIKDITTQLGRKLELGTREEKTEVLLELQKNGLSKSSVKMISRNPASKNTRRLMEYAVRNSMKNINIARRPRGYRKPPARRADELDVIRFNAFGETTMSKLGFKLSHQVAATNILYCKFFTIELENIVRNYFEELLSLISEIIINDDEKTTKDSNAMAVSADSDTSSTSSNSNMKIGGTLDQNLKNNLIWALEYGIPDSLHDFGKATRNKIFPENEQGKTKSHAFLNIAEKFLGINYTKKYTQGPISNNDILYPYYNPSPASFEEEVKVAFLLGQLCGDVDNLYYYFNEEIPSTWSGERLEYFKNSPPNSLNKFFEKLEKDEYKYCILDACMSIQKEEQWTSHITMLHSLCNLWDPVGAGKFKASELADGDNNLGLQLIAENQIIIDKIEYSVYDSKKSSDLKSMYDYVYNNLLNGYCLEQFNISFKLRLLGPKITSGNFYSTGESNNDEFFYVCLLIDNIADTKVFIINSGGFSVAVLSYGLYYIEKGESYKHIPSKQTKDYQDLLAILDYIKGLLEKITPKLNNELIKKYLYIFITRLKSTGDHGSAMTSKFFNDELKKKTVYLSGDQLAYVYSISKDIPTVSRYYFSTKGGADEGEDEIEDNSDNACSRIHFLSVLLPEQDPVVNCQNKLTEIYTVLYKIIQSTSVKPPTSVPMSQDIVSLIQTSLDNAMAILCDDSNPSNNSNNSNNYNPTNVIQREKFEKNVLEPLPIIVISLSEGGDIGKVITVTNSDVQKCQVILPLLKQYQDYLIYFLNFNEINAAQIKTINDQLKELDKAIIITDRDQIIKGSATVINASSRRPSSFRLQLWLESLVTKNKNVSSTEFVTALAANGESNTKTYYDKLLSIKKNFFEQTAKLSVKMKEKYGTSSPFIMEKTKQTFDIYNERIEQVLKKDTSRFGGIMLQIFGWTNEPVVAVPIDDEDSNYYVTVADEIVDKPLDPQDKIKPNSFKRIKTAAKNAINSMANAFTNISKKGGANHTRRIYMDKKTKHYTTINLRKTHKITKHPKYINNNVTKRRL